MQDFTMRPHDALLPGGHTTRHRSGHFVLYVPLEIIALRDGNAVGTGAARRSR
jgi:hypothetical protein